MAWSHLRVDAVLEVVVMLFQFIGVATLCLTRLVPETRWADRGRIGFVFALVGLGVFGALCGRFDSEFALFAGGTMTVLLIGMIAGSGSTHATAPRRRPMVAEPKPIA
jgi:uncharacterized membrane protein YhaH (DUF805 family)